MKAATKTYATATKTYATVTKNSNLFLGLAILFCVSLIVSNVIGGKLYQVAPGIVLPAGVWLFPIVYIIGDIIPEVYGLKAARRVIWIGFLANLYAVGFFTLALVLPHPEYWQNQEAFQAVLGYTPRLLLASFAGYLVGTNANAWIMVWVKRLTAGRFLWLRTISSTIVGEGLDSILFVLIAFYGLVPMGALSVIIISQAVWKIGYEALATPLTYLAVGLAKRRELGPASESDLSFREIN